MKKAILFVFLIGITASVYAVDTFVTLNAAGMKGPGAVSITSVNQMYVELYFTTAIGGNTVEGWNDSIWGSGGGSPIFGTLIDTYSASGGKIDPVNFTSSLGNEFWTGAFADTQKDPVDGWGSFYMKLYYSPTGIAGTGNHTYSGVTRLYDVNLNNILVTPKDLTMTSVTSQNRVDWVAVPEPATMALFGLGGLALVIRRKMRKEA